MRGGRAFKALRRRRSASILVASAAILAVTAAVAWGAPASIVGQGNDTFNLPAYTHDAGTVAQLTVTGSNHNVTSNANGPDGQKLFRSNTISSGTTPVNGTQYVAAGSYPFICTIHPSTMQATLNVTGSPQARPTIDITVTSRKLEKVVKKGKISVRATTTGNPEVDLEARLGKRRIGTGTIAAGGTTGTVKLTKSGRQALDARAKATVLVTGSIDFGSPDTAKRKLK